MMRKRGIWDKKFLVYKDVLNSSKWADQAKATKQ